MYVNIIRAYRYVVAICDEELIGKKFEQGNFQLDIKENFYKGERVTEKELKKIMINMKKEDATFNIVGKKSVSIALELGIIKKEGTMEIAGIPYALILL